MTIPSPRSVAALVCAGSLALAAAGGARTDSLTPREQALHVLNRLGFGPRPGDVDRVLQMGVTKYVETQLRPESIPDRGTEARLAGFPTLGLSNAELFERYEVPFREARKKIKAERAAREGADDSEMGADDLQKLRDLIPPENRPKRILEELTAARILRASESQRQLNEVVVDFWMNHFNVYANKGLDRLLIGSFERDTIRPHVWGKFEDLLQATAKSPAMLFYLDNARSVADEEHRPAAAREGFLGRARGRRMAGSADIAPEMLAKIKENAPRGLNENYARELMELHTLGVDGGYTQKDVTELARVLTGWSIARPRLGGVGEDTTLRGGRAMREAGEPGSFVFRAGMHDNGVKTVLGNSFSAGGGIEEGEQAIHMLAHHPATARHIAYALCQRLVADEPPQSLVDRVAQRFLQTDGDLRETVRAIVTSGEFFEARYYRAKVKSPFEYVVSAVRALGGSTDGKAVARQIAQMGEPLYLCQPPTGYADTSEAWVNSGALLARLNFALALAQSKLPGTPVEAGRLLPAQAAGTDHRSVQESARALVGTELSPETQDAIRKRVAEDGDGAEPGTLIAGLILGSPEFQRQ